MRYFTCNEFDANNFYTSTLSEDEVRETYYPYWYGMMCKKYGQDHVDATYTFEDCLQDWIVVNWGWESDAEGKYIQT